MSGCTHLDTSFSDGGELMLQHVQELSLGDPVAVHDDAVRLEPARALVEHYQQLLHHAAHLMNYLLSETWRQHRYHTHQYHPTRR